MEETNRREDVVEEREGGNIDEHEIRLGEGTKLSRPGGK